MCSCLQCPQLSELVCLLLWQLSVSFCIFHRHRVCLADRVDFICSLSSWWEGFWSSLATQPWVLIVLLFPPLHAGDPLGFAPEAALEDLGVEVVQSLGLQGLAAPGTQGCWRLGRQDIWCSGRVWQPVLANMLQYSSWRTPLTEKPGRPQSLGLQRVGHG